MISCPAASFVYKIKLTIEENLLPPASSIAAFLPPKSNYSTGHDMTPTLTHKTFERKPYIRNKNYRTEIISYFPLFPICSFLEISIYSNAVRVEGIVEGRNEYKWGKYEERARCPFHKTIKIILHLCNAELKVEKSNRNIITSEYKYKFL
ncbi:MAG: hypothetical protein F6K54_39075 [Okeania sp. SIO3B5]|uniref:hypothetical protein n=1 Tax=Okeania sp. SIO3B5 TaxID=2607811 RepID=UPI0014012F22|nr:hypothetical protein [Okeania sp. SIO3B5]NEO58533.1 hypothetical protein [Okeania sp. SIO3B5]